MSSFPFTTVMPILVKNTFIVFLDKIIINQNQIVKTEFEIYDKRKFNFMRKGETLTTYATNRELSKCYQNKKPIKTYFEVSKMTMSNNEIIRILRER